MECDICGKMYYSKTIEKHKLFVHLKNPEFQCSVCERAFKTPTQLQRHLFSHTEKRPYNCHLCATGYYRTDYLKNHYAKSHGIDFASNQQVLNNCIKLKSVDKYF